MVVYIYNRDGKAYALAFGGRRTRPDFHYSFRSQERREQHVHEYLDGLRKIQARKDAERARRANFRHGYKVGDVLHYSWGYEQTNCEFYQVTATTPGTITLRELQQRAEPGSMISHGMAENRVAVKDKFLDKSEPITKRVQWSESGPGYVSMPHGCATLWDGRPMYCSWYA